MDDTNTQNVNINDHAQEKISELEAKIAELENNWRRALADYKNLEKRNSDERVEMFDFANRGLLVKLLNSFDNLFLVDTHLNDAGLKMIVKELKDILMSEGLVEFGNEGDTFDPAEMDAYDVEEDTEMDGKVIQVSKKGYKYKNKILRPALVKVGRKKEE